MSDKIAAERDFHLHTMKEAIERMKAELMAARLRPSALSPE
jgi:hypothetical protein